MNTPSKSYIHRLIELRKDSGAMSALRKYWSPSTRHLAYPVFGHLSALPRNPRRSQHAILAALYAEHSKSWTHSPHEDGLPLGKSALDLGKRERNEQGREVHPYDRHFRRLLACQELGTIDAPGDLPSHLHRLIKRLNRDGIALDYAELHKNLNFWAKHRDLVLLRWASDFWNTPIPTETVSQL